MIEKRTVIDQIEVTRSGRIQIRFALEIVENGEVISSSYHRTAVDPGETVEDKMAIVDAHLLAMGKTGIADDGMPGVLATIARVVHTPEVVATFEAAAASAAADSEK